MKKKITIYSCILLFLLLSICFITFIKFKYKKDADDIIYIGNYAYMPNKEKYIEIVTKKWKELGHTSKLIFEDWDCYEEFPNDKYEIYIYDSVIYESLRNKDIIEDIDNIDTSYTFDWANNLLENENKVYAIPFLLCSDFLIYNKNNIDLTNINKIEDINTSFTTQYKSMVLNYYLTALLSLENENVILDIEKGNYSDIVLEKLYTLMDKMNAEDYTNSSSSTYIGKEQMNKKVYNAMYGFSESIYYLKDIIDEIDIKNISLIENTNNKAYYVDLISMKNEITDKEEDLYTELINLMVSEEVNYEYLYNEGDYFYLLTANKNVLNHLAQDNRLYNKLYNFVSLDNNRVFLYSKDYYNEFSLIKDDLKNISDTYEKSYNRS